MSFHRGGFDYEMEEDSLVWHWELRLHVYLSTELFLHCADYCTRVSIGSSTALLFISFGRKMLSFVVSQKGWTV